MKVESSVAMLLDESGALSIAQLVEQSGLTEPELRALVDCGALAPRDAHASTWTFSARYLVTARTARRLRDDFALEDADAVALVVQFAQRIEQLEQELRRLRALL